MIRGLLCAAFTVLVWGVTFVNTKALLRDFSALEIQVLRFGVAYVALWVLHPQRLRTTAAEERRFAALGATGVAVYQMMENCAIHYTNASNVAILVALCPMVTALLARAHDPSKRLPPSFFAGFPLAMAGVAAVSLSGIQAFHFQPIGDGMALVAMLSWGFYSLLTQSVRDRGYPVAILTRKTFFWSLVMLAPVCVFGLTSVGRVVLDGSFAVSLGAAKNAARFSDLWNLIHLGFLGLLASALCFALWNKACFLLGVVRCTVGLYLVPAVTVLFAAAFLGERLTVASGIGAVLIVAGVAISARAPKRG